MPIGHHQRAPRAAVFHGVERPFVDTVIIPSTWFDIGAGIHGEVGRGLRYRAYVMAPLDALEFTADEGIRERPAEGLANRTCATSPHRPCRSTSGCRGLTLGASVWSGKSSFAAPRLDSRCASARSMSATGATGWNCAASSRRCDHRRRAAQRSPSGSSTGVSPNIARALRGFYGEGAYRVWAPGPAARPGGFVRYENFDTQFRMPDGLPAAERVRSRRLGGGRHLLSGSGHRGEGRLRLAAEHELGRRGTATASTSASAGGSDAACVMWSSSVIVLVLVGGATRERSQADARGSSESAQNASRSRLRKSSSNLARRSSCASRATTPRTASASPAPASTS